MYLINPTENFKIRDTVYTICPVELYPKSCRVIDVENCGSVILTLETECPYFEITNFKREAVFCEWYDPSKLLNLFLAITSGKNPWWYWDKTENLEKLNAMFDKFLNFYHNEGYSSWLIEHLVSLGWAYKTEYEDERETYVFSSSGNLFWIACQEDKWCHYWDSFVPQFEKIAKELKEEPKELFRKINKYADSNNRSDGVR